MRIGLVTDFYYPWIGGPSTVVRHLGQGLAARGHSVFLLAPSPTGPASVEWEGSVQITRAHTCPVPFGYNVRSALFPRSCVSLWLERSQLDVVHVHHPFPLSATTVFLANRLGIPVMATNHTIPQCSLWGIRKVWGVYPVATSAFGWWLRLLIRRCGPVATPTKTAADALRSLGFAGAVDVISNGVDIHCFAPGQADEQLRRRLGLDGRPVVLYTGRLDAEKQMDIWLRAAAKVARRLDVQFLVGGHGAERASLEGLARKLGLASRLRFFGYLSEDDFPGVYRLADAYCITSPVELQSISTLEAIASGLPVVAVRAGALPELVHDGVNGYLVEPGDWDQAASCLVELLQDTTERQRKGDMSRTIALSHDLARTIDRYEQLFRGACNSWGELQLHERASASR